MKNFLRQYTWKMSKHAKHSSQKVQILTLERLPSIPDNVWSLHQPFFLSKHRRIAGWGCTVLKEAPSSTGQSWSLLLKSSSSSWRRELTWTLLMSVGPIVYTLLVLDMIPRTWCTPYYRHRVYWWMFKMNQVEWLLLCIRLIWETLTVFNFF